MQTIQRRLLQVAVIALALTMLGIYVVRSQQSRQPGQVAPSSKLKALSGAIQTVAPPGTNSQPPSQTIIYSTKSAPVIETKSVVASPSQSVVTNPASHVMMPGSKSLIMLPQPDANSTPPLPPFPVTLWTNNPGSNQVIMFRLPPGQTLMVSTKSAPVFKAESLVRGPDQIPATNSPSQMMMPGSKSAGLVIMHIDERIDTRSKPETQPNTSVRAGSSNSPPSRVLEQVK